MECSTSLMSTIHRVIPFPLKYLPLKVLTFIYRTQLWHTYGRVPPPYLRVWQSVWWM